MRSDRKAHLTHLQTVDACVDVDAVRAENAQQHDVHVVPLHDSDSTEIDARTVGIATHIREERNQVSDERQILLRGAQDTTEESGNERVETDTREG